MSRCKCPTLAVALAVPGIAPLGALALPTVAVRPPGLKIRGRSLPPVPPVAVANPLPPIPGAPHLPTVQVRGSIKLPGKPNLPGIPTPSLSLANPLPPIPGAPHLPALPDMPCPLDP